MAEKELIDIEVAYARPEQQVLLELRVPVGSTAEEAIHASGIRQYITETDVKNLTIGIFGKLCQMQQVLHAGDRLEIYRPLVMDPMQQRRQRVEKHK